MIKRREGENAQQYLWRIGNLKDAGVIEESWNDLAEQLNNELGINKGGDSYRKEYSVAKRYRENVFTESCDISRAEILKAQAQTKNIETNRLIREYARDELILEEIRKYVSELKPFEKPETYITNRGKRVAVLCFGDEHFGTEFTIYGLNGEIINHYDDKVFYDRMWELFSETLKIILDQQIDDLYIFSLGDFADGILRVSQLAKLQYGVIESTVKYAEFISTWLNKFTEWCRVHFQMTPGNHTELRMLGQPKGTFKNENMDVVVRAFIKARMEGNPNFEFKENKTGFIYDEILGYKFLGIHGEVRDPVNAVKEFSHAYNVRINYMVAGHMHHSRLVETGIDSEYIGVPSVIGSDSYSLDLRRTSRPAASLLIIEDGKGKTVQYTINLKGGEDFAENTVKEER